MSDVLSDLLDLLALEPLEKNLFRGRSQDLGWGAVFGGQVLGQALTAAARTVPADRAVHSMQAYFLRPGDTSAPIVYDVDRIRDGGAFTTRRVVAIQHGEPIFNLAASFQRAEPGFEHADPMPSVPDPEQLPTYADRLQPHLGRLPPFLRDRASAERPFDLRLVGDEDPITPAPTAPWRALWLRTAAALPDDPVVHQALVAYASDYSFLTTALLPHGVSWLTPGMHVASIDHVMWFHAPFRVDEWLLHVVDSPRAAGARGLVRGRLYRRDGTLVASTAQEGLIRRREKP